MAKCSKLVRVDPEINSIALKAKEAMAIERRALLATPEAKQALKEVVFRSGERSRQRRISPIRIVEAIAALERETSTPEELDALPAIAALTFLKLNPAREAAEKGQSTEAETWRKSARESADLNAEIIKRCDYIMQQEGKRIAGKSGVPLHDLHSAGITALLSAIGRYEEDKSSFETYARIWIRSHQGKMARNTSQIHVPQHADALRRRIETKQMESREQTGRALEAWELAEALDVTEMQVQNVTFETLNLDYSDGIGSPVSERIAAERAPDPMQEYDSAIFMGKLFSSLPSKMEEASMCSMLRLPFNFREEVDYTPLSLEEAQSKLLDRRMRVIQLLKKLSGRG